MRLIVSIFVYLFLLPVFAHAAEVKIAIAGPMTGGMAAFGEQITKGAEIAVEELNAQGGLLGKKVALVKEDDACDSKQAHNVASKLANQKVAVVIGHWCSMASMAAAGTYTAEGILQIENGGTLVELTQHGAKNIFRMSATGQAFARALTTYTNKHNPNAKVAIITDRSAVTMALTDSIRQYFENSPAEIVATEQITTGEKDFASIIDRLKNAEPDVLICSCYTVEAGLIARQLKQKKLDPYFYSWDTIDSPDFLHIVGKENTSKIVSIDYARPSQGNNLYRHLQQELWQHHWIMETQTAVTYSAIELYVEAVNVAHTFETDKVAEVLRRGSFPTALGDVRFTKNGDRINPEFSAYQWVDGDLKVKENLGR